MLERIDHVGYAVDDLEQAVRHHERLYGGRVTHRETIDSDGVTEALVAVGGSYIQLLTPTRADSPVARFLDRHGPGLHHVGYGVADVAAALERLKAAGVRPLDESPRPGSRGTTVAFVHPRDALGVLVELVEDPSGPRR
ncbi:MAG: methylmalonyl-CoA epimerase [Actinomycetota bacterium]|nr:methylmalonyl-CoA epimerase [Actinomycetota bacterium]